MPSQSATTVRSRRALWTAVVVLAVIGSVASLELFGRIAAATVLGHRLPGQEELFAGVRNAAAAVLAQRADASVIFDAALGWRPQPGVNNGIDHINGQALRSLQEFAAVPPPHVTRVSVFGDSFVYGTEVATQRAWPTLLDENEPALEILNYGVPGYGPDQALLRFELEVADLRPGVAILAITTPSLTRLLTVASVFHSTQPYFLTKPRFIIDAQRTLTLLPNPVASLEEVGYYAEHPQAILKLGQHDYWYRPWIHDNPIYEASYTFRLAAQSWFAMYTRYLDDERPLAGPPGAGVFNAQSEGFEILTLLMQRFRAKARALGMKPLILLLPDGYSVAASREGGRALMEPVLEYSRAQGFEVLDATQAFAEQPSSVASEEWFFGLFHYNEAGNALVAEWLGNRLQALR